MFPGKEYVKVKMPAGTPGDLESEEDAGGDARAPREEYVEDD